MDREHEALEIYLRVFSWLLLIAALMPFDFYGNEPVWPWAGLLDGNWADRAAILLPVVAAAIFVIMVRTKLPKVSMAVCMLVVLACAWLIDLWSGLGVHGLGVYDRLASGLPPLFGRAFWLLILGNLVLVAGIRLGAAGYMDPGESRSSIADPWPLARWMTAAGILLVLLFYLLPYRGGVPVFQLFSGIVELSHLVEEPAGMALLAGHVLSLGPLCFAAASIPRIFRRAPEHGGMLMVLLLAFVPVLSLLTGMRNFIVLASYTLLHIRAASIVLAVTAGGAIALAAAIRGSWYEVPWNFGCLRPMDSILARGLSETDKGAGVDGLISRLNFMLRPFARRRLALWRTASTEVPGADGEDLSRVMQFLSRRRLEELGNVEKKEPGWLFGHRLTLAGGIVIVCIIVTSISMAHRDETRDACMLNPSTPELEELFTEQIPAVVIEMSRHEMPLENLPSYGPMYEGLCAIEHLCPGLKDAVLDLLELGAHGRNRLHSVWRARDKLNRLLHEHGMPFFLRSRVRAGRGVAGRDLFYLLDYRVVECRVYGMQGRDSRYPVLHLVRVDPLNVVEQYVGATAEEEAFVSILLDRVEEFLRRRFMPVVESDDALGEASRLGVRALTGSPEADCELSGAVGELVTEGLTRHELHHKWLGLEPEPPTPLWAWMSGYSEDAVSGVASEVGAYLGELGYSPAYARIRIALMLDAMDDIRGHGGTHGLARLYLLASLFEFDLDVDRRWLAAAVRLAGPLLVAMKNKELSERLDELHRDLFGIDIPRFTEIERRVPSDHCKSNR